MDPQLQGRVARFAQNDIISLVSEHAARSLGESYGPSIHLDDLGAFENSTLSSLELAYSSAQGDVTLRSAIAKRYGVSADDVIVTVGGAHALFLCAFTLCAPGDSAIATTPAFPPTRAGLDAVGARVTVLHLRFDDGYRLDLDEFRRCLSPQTKLVSVASPQNPSGVLIPRETLREMLAIMSLICPAAFLLVDEVFREASYGDDAIVEPACSLGDRIISIASLSKCHGAPGLRIGWIIVADRALRDQLVAGKFNTVISCSPIDEHLAVRVLNRHERVVNERRAHLRECLDAMASWVERNDRYVEWVRPQAGAICCVRLKASAFSEGAAQRFYDEVASAGTRVANGAWFGDEPRVFRVGFALLSPLELSKALAVLSSALERCALTGGPAS